MSNSQIHSSEQVSDGVPGPPLHNNGQVDQANILSQWEVAKHHFPEAHIARAKQRQSISKEPENTSVEAGLEGFSLEGPLAIERLAGSSYGDTIVGGNARVQLGNTIHIHHDTGQTVKKKIDVFEELRESLRFGYMDARLRNIADALPETCQWLENHPHFCSWLNVDVDNKTEPFLWLKGKPGCGKSTLMKQVVQRSVPESRFHHTFSFFFNARSAHELEKSSLGCYRSLTHQLLAAVVPWQPAEYHQENTARENPQPFVQVADSTRRLFLQMFSAKARFRDASTRGDLRTQNLGNGILGVEEQARFDVVIETWSETELQNFLLDFFLLDHRPIIRIFIDALDEGTEDDVRRMVRILSRAAQTGNKKKASLRICFSSRHYPNIAIANCLTLFVERESGHAADIEKYISSELSGDRSVQMTEVRQLVSDKAGGVFMWVVLVIPMLNKAYDRGKSLDSMLRLLQDIPPDLSNVFNQVLFGDPDGFEETVSLLQWVLYAKRPLRDTELYYAVLFSSTKTLPNRSHSMEVRSDRLQQYINNCSRGLVEYGKEQRNSPPEASASTIQFIHESVRDYLLRHKYIRTTSTAAAEVLSACFETAVCNAILAEICLSYFLAICRNKVEKRKHFFWSYAAKHWWQHVQAGQSAVTSASVNMICDLLTKHETLKEWQAQDPVDTSAEFIRTITLTWAKKHIAGDGTRSFFDEGRGIIRDSAGPVYYAALLGLTDVVDELCRRGCQTATIGGYWETPLNAASFGGFESSVKSLILNGAELEVHHPKFGTALNIAAEFGHDRVVEELLKSNANANASGKWGSPLITASLHGYQDILTQLLEHNANVNLTAGDHLNALRAAADSGHSDIVRLLLESGADPNIHDTSALELHGDRTARSTALQRAVARNDVASVKLLLVHGAKADVEEVDDEPRPLITAISNQNEVLTKVLLDYGADYNLRDKRGITPLEYACGSIDLGIFKLLLDRGADVNARFSSDTTALERASGAGDLALVRFLLKKEADPNSEGKQYSPTALCYAARNKHLEVAKLLLDAGAKVNVCSKIGTPLIAACVGLGDARSMVELLLSYGAQVNQRNTFNGETPLWKAANWGNGIVMRLLIEHGGGSIDTATISKDYYGDAEANGDLQCPGAPIISDDPQFDPLLESPCSREQKFSSKLDITLLEDSALSLVDVEQRQPQYPSLDVSFLGDPALSTTDVEQFWSGEERPSPRSSKQTLRSRLRNLSWWSR